MDETTIRQNRLSESAENYLKTISILCKREQHGHAHVADIADTLKVKKPSVTAALRNLCEEGLIEYKTYSPVTLTDKGQEYADQILKDYDILCQFMCKCGGFSAERAHEAACHLEHWISDKEIQELRQKLQDSN